MTIIIGKSTNQRDLMDLLLTEEQGMLRDSAATFTARRCGAVTRRGSETKINKDIWHQAAEAGWLAILAPDRRADWIWVLPNCAWSPRNSEKV